MTSIKILIKTLMDSYLLYCNNSKLLIVFFGCLVFLCFSGREYRIKIVYPTFIVLGILFNPVLYVKFFSKFLDATTWRIMWLIPVVPVIALTVNRVICLVKGKESKKFIVSIAACFLMAFGLVVCGDNIYGKENTFQKASNLYKLPQSTIDLVDRTLEITDNPVCEVPEGFLSYTRQYNSSFRQIYGRNAYDFIDFLWEENPSAYAVFLGVRHGNNFVNRVQTERLLGCNVIITTEKNEKYRNVLKQYGFESVENKSNLDIYYNSYLENLEFYWSLEQRGYEDESQRMSYVIEGQDKELIVIDGGFSGYDDWMVQSKLEQHDNHVNAWILTSLDAGHIGVFLDYYKNENIKIDNIYIMGKGLNDALAYQISLGNDAYKELGDFLATDESVHFVDTDAEYDVCGLKMQVLDKNCVSEDSSDELYGMMFALMGKTETILFASDIWQDNLEVLQEYMKENPVDYLQIALHEMKNYQSEVSEIGTPKVVFVDATISEWERFVTEGEALYFNYERYGGVVNYKTVPNGVRFD